MSLEDEFQEAVEAANALPKQPNAVQLKLYGLYKQVTAGDVQGERPGAMNVRARAKYDAWASRKGMSKADAIDAYLELVDQLEAEYA